MDITSIIKKMDFRNLNVEIKRGMRRSAKDAVQVGYMLRRVLEEQLYTAEYDDFDTYLQKELNIDYTMATRFIKLNKKYSVRGDSMEIAAEYEDYSQSLLIEMLNMPSEVEAQVTSDMSVRQVQQMKRKVRTPKKEEVIIDGDFREVEHPVKMEKEKVATSQLNILDVGLPCDDCMHDVNGSCNYPDTPEDYCVMGDKKKDEGRDNSTGTCAGTSSIEE